MKNFKLFSVGLFALSSALSFAQNQTKPVPTENQTPLTFLDSLKQTFVSYEKSNKIDELWMRELTNQDLFDEMYNDVTTSDAEQEVAYNLSTEVLKERLARLNEKSPFNVVYNKTLENVIKSFLKKRSKSYERLMALSEYYFPMFEEHLEKYNLPLEIKYLAIVESALNPHAKSYVGATGLWQFMYATGKQYNLEVNSYVDERYDPLKATEAACKYFTDMYKIFGDWDLVLASYNTGPGNVSKAIRRSGGKKNYWNLRPYLHRETQGYLPAFYATMYIYEYHKEHGINPKKAPIAYLETDTVMVKQKINFNQISDLLDIPVEQIKFLNPIYKVEVIPYITDKPHYLRLPKDKLAIYQANEDKIYAYVDYQDSKIEKPFESTRLASNADYEIRTETKIHKIKKGESLGVIASKNKVSITDLRRWNNIKGNMIRAGQNLKIQKTTRVAVTPKPEEVRPKISPLIEKKKIEKKVLLANNTDNEMFLKHVVEENETLQSIASNYNVSASELIKVNEIDSNQDLVGETLLISLPAAVKKNTALKSNKQIKQKSNTRNSLAEEAKQAELKKYVVKKGDTLYKISTQTGLSIAHLKKVNNLKSDDIKPGQVLKI